MNRGKAFRMDVTEMISDDYHTELRGHFGAVVQD